MNMNEEYLDNLLKSMNNTSAVPEAPEGEDIPFRATEADLKPAKEDTVGGSLTPEEIAALFDAAEKIANGEEPEPLPEEAAEEEPVSQPEEAAEEEPVILPEETAEEEPMSQPEEAAEEEPVSQPEEAAEEEPVILPEETAEEEPVILPEETAEEEPVILPEETPGQEIGSSADGNVVEMDPVDIDELLQDKTEKKEKKPGFFKRLLTLFTEEAAPKEEPQKDENEEVLEELDKEDKTAEQDKKKKKEKKKKDKPAKGKGTKKNAKAGNEEDGDEEEDGKPEKGKGRDKGKAKKASKKKKEKQEVPEQEEKVSRGYTKKNIIRVCLFSAAVFAVLYLGISYVAPCYVKKNAVTAFENQDYLTCYEILYGQKLTEREQQLFTFSNMVLRMQKKINDYDKYVEDGENLYALDSLMQAVEEYEETQEEALACGADGEMLKLYREVLTILQENYELDEEGVRSIAFCDNKVEYTRMLDTLINGGTVDIKDEPAADMEDLPDLLPEEEETDDTEFLPEDIPNTEILPEDAGNTL